MKDLILNIVGIGLEIYFFLLIGRILASWLPALAESKFGEFLFKVTEPYLAPFRKIIPPIGGMLDISPILAFLAFHYLREFLLIGLASVLSWIGL